MTMSCGHDEAALRMTHRGDTICSGCAGSGQRTIVVSEHRCHERNGLDQRCTLVGEHQTVINSKSQRAIVHETKDSIWSVPLAQLN